jgi:hypothetical protein
MESDSVKYAWTSLYREDLNLHCMCKKREQTVAFLSSSLRMLCISQLADLEAGNPQ